ncbi:hypothetical protein J3Q64DRAFT_1729456 [Phycomyces blakesleeanus]|uniref:Uncharacterized protein n=1 Tax=Phycomyces blakesleeanus TaxID=4837 RepID=A0ABR3B741_PHYBL
MSLTIYLSIYLSIYLFLSVCLFIFSLAFSFPFSIFYYSFYFYYYYFLQCTKKSTYLLPEFSYSFTSIIRHDKTAQKKERKQYSTMQYSAVHSLSIEHIFENNV